ncbi:hypothetical protein FK220_007325 [Flavobacteriaceae bacterium TP-CH-4]|uniref:Uncharacterized protein n=1 Tax=Pelagihabitans pacificus TaxID=2696054 RepID=A0A967E611_9FLAO|nr:hypothetical protein [Pelagihabitans pacificus]NHF59145.1 hypothetical protein [Pelagihabitans pacificus]
MRRFVFILGTIILSLGFYGCNDDDGVNFHFAALEVVAAELPESFDLNGQYQITVTYFRPDDCTFFEGFDVVQEDTTIRNVIVVGSVITNRECAEKAEEVEATFNFVVLHDQDYLFRFWQGQDENGEPQYLEIEVPVN